MNPGPDASARSVTKNLFTMIHVNSRSLLRHFDDVACLMSTERPHILALSETWLDASVSNAEIHIPGYSLFRSDRNRSGGGVAVYYLDNLPCSLLSCGTTPSGAESLWVSVRCGSLHPSLVVGCFYRPPGAPSQSVLDVCDNIDAMILNTKYVVACGDFNIDMLDLTKPHSKTFQNFITSRSLIQTISKPTRYNNSTATILDLFVTTPDVPISNSSILNKSFSDHLPIRLRINMTEHHPQPSFVTHCSFKHFCVNSFKDDLSRVPWSVLDVFDDPGDKADAFTLLFVDVLDDHAPSKTTRVKKNPSPWITKTILKEMARRDRLHRFFRRNPTSAAWDIYKAQRNRVVWLQRKAKIEFFHNLLLKKPHPSSIWKTLRLATSSSSPSNDWSSFRAVSNTIANTLNNHFLSISSSTTSPIPAYTPHPVSQPTGTFSLSQPTPDMCEQALASLKARCATGLDCIPSSALIASRSVICFPLSSIINSSIT